jgi:hypothetical protein
VYFSCFNPVWPILACGLSGGTTLIIEGEKKTDLVATWENKRWFNINATSATTDLGWNVKKMFRCLSQILYNLIIV